MNKVEQYLFEGSMNKIKFHRLNSEPPDETILTSGEMDYHTITLDGYLLMYKRNKYRPDSLRLYHLNNELAKYLGFHNIDVMRKMVRLQWWRGMLSVKALKRRFR
jgi:hypothetical protein